MAILLLAQFDVCFGTYSLNVVKFVVSSSCGHVFIVGIYVSPEILVSLYSSLAHVHGAHTVTNVC